MVFSTGGNNLQSMKLLGMDQLHHSDWRNLLEVVLKLHGSAFTEQQWIQLPISGFLVLDCHNCEVIKIE